MRSLITAVVLLGLTASTVLADVGLWRVTGGSVAFDLSTRHLEDLGFAVTASRLALPAENAEENRFPISGDLLVRLKNGKFDGVHAGDLHIDGGLAFEAWDPISRRAQAPQFLYGGAVELLRGESQLRVSGTDGTAVVEGQNSGFWFDPDAEALRLLWADGFVTEAWATELGRPELAGHLLGGLSLTLELEHVSGHHYEASPAPLSRGGTFLDVTLGELYGMIDFGRTGTHPNGRVGLAASTTSCNTGDVDVPWFGPMDEGHPLIGLTMFRLENDRLEMIGRNYMKHGFFALDQSDCDPCPSNGNGDYLLVDCADTYSAFNNASRFYLGPREEVNPFTGDWTACGSFFDEPGAPDGDCDRDYNGTEPNEVNHRLEVEESDLNRPGATFFYEGIYVVPNDDDRTNNIAHRELANVSYNAGSGDWQFQDLSDNPLEPQVPRPGPVVTTWGDGYTTVTVPGDGDVILAHRTTDLGGGWWEYDYVLYNRDSARALYSLEIPVNNVNVQNVFFRDIDQDAGNQWTSTVAGGVLRFETDDFATDPNANSLEYQVAYNFRFEAQSEPTMASAAAGIFRPGSGTSIALTTAIPNPVGLDVPVVSGPTAALQLTGANPFPAQAQVRFSLRETGPAKLSIVDVRGRQVRVLRDGPAAAGTHDVTWDARDSAGRAVASGVFFVRLETSTEAHTVRATLRR